MIRTYGRPWMKLRSAFIPKNMLLGCGRAVQSWFKNLRTTANLHTDLIKNSLTSAQVAVSCTVYERLLNQVIPQINNFLTSMNYTFSTLYTGPITTTTNSLIKE